MLMNSDMSGSGMMGIGGSMATAPYRGSTMGASNLGGLGGSNLGGLGGSMGGIQSP